MTNPKIEKVDASIAKTKAKIAEYQAKLRDLERQRTVLEDAEIVARFRSENLTDDDIAELVRMRQNNNSAGTPVQIKEEKPEDEA